MAARDHGAAYRRRVELAKQRGFISLRQQQKAPRQIRNLADLQALPKGAREARTAALRVLNLARKQHLTVDGAARKQGVPLTSVRWWAAPALRPAPGATRVTKGDRLLRLEPLVVKGKPGVQFIPIRGSEAARRAREAFALQYAYVEGKKSPDELRRLAGLRIVGFDVEDSSDVLDEYGRRGELDPAENYRAMLP